MRPARWPSIEVQLPLTDDVVRELHSGDYVYLTGARLHCPRRRPQAHVEALAKGEALPIDIRGEVIYYVGPTPAKPGQIIGSAGPTTAERMDPFTIPLLDAGLRGAIGKGGRSPEIAEAFREHGAVYFIAVGGAGALLSRQITSVEVVAYEDLGTEAIRRMTLDRFPVVVCNDVHGGDVVLHGRDQWRR